MNLTKQLSCGWETQFVAQFVAPLFFLFGRWIPLAQLDMTEGICGGVI
jgi:hypothetical protein